MSPISEQIVVGYAKACAELARVLIIFEGNFLGVTQMGGKVELRVWDGEENTLVYVFETASKAAEMIHFLTEFFPKASFVVQPLRH